MKKYAFLFLVMFCFCSRNEVRSDVDSSNDSLRKFLTYAESNNFNYEKRRDFNHKALSIILKRENDSLNRENLLRVAWNYYYINCWKDFRTTTNIALTQSTSKNATNHIAESYRYIGIYYENVNMNDSAFHFYLKAEKIYKQFKDEKRLCKIYLDKAQVQYYINDYLGSETTLIKALTIAKKKNFEYEKYRVYLSLGLICCEIKDYDKAFEYYDKALSLGKELETESKFNHPVAFCMYNIGAAHFFYGNLEKAIEIFELALKEENLEYTEPIIFCRLLDGLGAARLKLNQYKNSKINFYRSSKIREDFNIEHGKNFNKLYLSEYYTAVKDTLKAKQYAHEAFNLSKSFKAPKDMLLCLKQLSVVEPENALKYSQDYIKVSDSMQQIERENRNKFAKIAYETEEITNQKDEAVQQKWISFCILTAMCILSVLIFIIIAQKVKQKEFQFVQEQQKSNEDIYELIQSQQTKIDEGRDLEKKRIAQELHDGIMNKLTSTRLNLHMLNNKNNDETIKKNLSFINEIQNIEKEIRNIAHDLNKEVFTHTVSFILAIEALLKEQRSISSIYCHSEFDKRINWDLIESNKKVHIYRIIQEGLNNCNKHSQAQNIVISIFDKIDHILLEIYDDGIGFSLNAKKKGIGLLNIYSRTNTFGGAVEIITKQGIGTNIMINIPKNLK